MSLFDVDGPDLDPGYRNLQAGRCCTERTIQRKLENMWQLYEPYADTDFKKKFSKSMDSAFWELYLSVQLIKQGKCLRRRCELSKGERDRGPDICVKEDNKKMWIEAVTPEAGAEENLDRVPPTIPIDPAILIKNDTPAQSEPRREVELRISGAIYDKAQKYRKYVKYNIIEPNDICIVAISLAKFPVSPFNISPVVTAAYPIGEKNYNLLTQFAWHVESWEIDRRGKDNINRTAFLKKCYPRISGIIWSQHKVGNFFLSDCHGISFVHNSAAFCPLSEKWILWNEEYVARELGEKMVVEQLSRFRR